VISQHAVPLDIEQVESLRLLMDNLPRSYLYQYTILSDGTQKFIYLSSGTFAVHGLYSAEIIKDASCLLRLTAPDDVPKLIAAQEESLRQLSDVHLEIRVWRPEGGWCWLELRSRPRRTENGLVIWDGVATDVTLQHEQKLKLELLAQRTTLLLNLQPLEEEMEEHEFMQEVLNRVEKLTSSEIGFMHFVNPDQESIELIAGSNSPLADAGIWADAARQCCPIVINDYAATNNKGGLPEGHSQLTRLISVPVLEAGDVRMLTGVGNKPTDYNELDIETLQLVGNETWRIVRNRRNEKALRIASQVVNASPVICFRWRAENNWPVEFVSENIAQWGYSIEDMLAGTPSFAQMIHPDDLQRVVDEVTGYTANGLNTYLQEYRLLTRDGQVIWVEDRTIVRRNPDSSVCYYDGVLTDMTDRKKRQDSMDKALATQRQLNKRLEEAHNQLLQSEKMASIGQLAAGIAHELNNPIGFVHSNMGTLEGYLRDLMEIIDSYEEYTQTLGEEAPPRLKIDQLKDERDFTYVRADIFSLLAESKDGLGRVRKIVQDLKSFSHVGEQAWQPADLHQGLDSTLNIVWNELKYKCTIKKEYADLPKVYCLISQLNQVFMNLLVNAGQAIESQGEISIRTARHGADCVLIEICDSGKGIAPEHLNRIFEPFFTTKAVGKGTGLGLSLSYSIIERHHGRIEVESTAGQGACFRVIIPIEQKGASQTQPATEHAA
jgi:PAS domain S-box-containing protein